MDRTTALPIDERIRVAIGARYQLRSSLVLGFSFVYLNLGSGDVSTATVSGDYSSNDVFIFGVVLDYQALPWSRSKI